MTYSLFACCSIVISVKKYRPSKLICRECWSTDDFSKICSLDLYIMHLAPAAMLDGLH